MSNKFEENISEPVQLSLLSDDGLVIKKKTNILVGAGAAAVDASGSFASWLHELGERSIGVVVPFLRRTRTVYRLTVYAIRKSLVKTFLRLLWLIKALLISLTRPIVDTAVSLKRRRIVMASRASKGFKYVIIDTLELIGLFFKFIISNFTNILNYVAPVLAALILIRTIAYFNTSSIALSVDYGGTSLGYIADQSVYENAYREMKSRIQFEDPANIKLMTPRFSLTVVDDEELIDSKFLSEKLLKQSGSILAEADGLYVDNVFIGAVENSIFLLDMLDSIKEEYRTDAVDESVEFINSVRVDRGLYPTSAIKPLSAIRDELKREKVAQKVYTVKANDVPTSIAVAVGMPYSLLKQMNPDIENTLIPGQGILIQRAEPLLGVMVIRKETVEEEINYKVIQTVDPKRDKGSLDVKNAGVRGLQAVTSEVVYIDGIETERSVIKTVVLKEPVHQQVVVGGNVPVAVPNPNSNYQFIWPVYGGRLSCGFYGYYNHGGMDIAAPIGTTIKAAAGGQVSMVKYTAGGYGRHMSINHGNGVETWYAHTSQIYVAQGEYVFQGQSIAAIGMTGRTTGPHLHFEIRINGRQVNPANYIGTTAW